MRAILSSFKLLLFGIWSLISIIAGALLFALFVKNGMEWIAKHFWSPVALKLMQAKITVSYVEPIVKTDRYLIMANHNSFIDIPILFKTMPFYTYFIAKKELKKIPLLGWYIKAYGMIYIDRSDSKKAQESIAIAASLIEAGKHVIIFPEGTKSKDGKIGPFKKGGFHLAQQANVAILPIKIEGAQFVWPNKKPFQLKRGTISVKIGAKITQESLAGLEITERVEFVRNKINEL